MNTHPEAAATIPAKTDIIGGFEYTGRDFAEIAGILREATGINLNDTKLTLVYSRLSKRLRSRGLASFRDYCDLIREDEDELQRMIEALTTNTTSFFRERHHFEHLQTAVMPGLAAAARSGARVRLWSSAASSGQEPYSIAMTVLSVLPDAASLDIRILATDINAQMVERGQRGQYEREDLSGIPAPLASRYLRTENDHAVVCDELKSLVSFRQLNLHERWPMRGSFDVVFCRNVMIYFSADTQAALWQRLGSQVAPGGHLYIGHSERLSGPASSEFELIGITTYRKQKWRQQ